MQYKYLLTILLALSALSANIGLVNRRDEGAEGKKEVHPPSESPALTSPDPPAPARPSAPSDGAPFGGSGPESDGDSKEAAAAIDSVVKGVESIMEGGEEGGEKGGEKGGGGLLDGATDALTKVAGAASGPGAPEGAPEDPDAIMGVVKEFAASLFEDVAQLADSFNVPVQDFVGDSGLQVLDTKKRDLDYSAVGNDLSKLWPILRSLTKHLLKLLAELMPLLGIPFAGPVISMLSNLL